MEILEAIEAGRGDAGRVASMLPRGESAGSRSRSFPFKLGALVAGVIGARVAFCISHESARVALMERLTLR